MWVRKIDVSSMHESELGKSVPQSAYGLEPASSQRGLSFRFCERKRSCKRQSATRRGHVVCDKSTRGQVEHATIRNNNKK